MAVAAQPAPHREEKQPRLRLECHDVLVLDGAEEGLGRLACPQVDRALVHGRRVKVGLRRKVLWGRGVRGRHGERGGGEVEAEGGDWRTFSTMDPCSSAKYRRFQALRGLGGALVSHPWNAAIGG